MIARPVNRPRPIPFATPAPGATPPRPVSWATSSGPAPQQPASLGAPPAMPPAPRPSALPAANQPSVTPARRSPVIVSNGKVRHAAHDPRPDARAPGNKDATQLSAKYIGHGALSIRSSVTGRHYRFQGHGDSQKIDKNDLMMLKRIADLIVA